MSGFKDIAKGGWHPKSKDGKSKESWRGDFRGVNQVAGWLGKGKEPNPDSQEHVSRPLSTLKDPASFGPPPKQYGGAALSSKPPTGLGAPLSREELQAKQQAEEEAEAQSEAEQATKSKGPPIPYRADTTGLPISHLPPPPGRKDSGARQPRILVKSKPPSLPPRLPPRQKSQPIPSVPSHNPQADPHQGILNQSSLNRLGAAGVSVPGFGIGPTEQTLLSAPASVPSSGSPAPVTSPASSSHVNELQSRFSRLTTTSSKPGSSKEGTTFADKQEAIRTASSFRNDPSSVSLKDAKAAATTANNFRDRHGEQAKAGWQTANTLNTKYGITNKVGSFRTSQSEPTVPASQKAEVAGQMDLKSFLGKKKPPPPPTKKADLTNMELSKEMGPPPIPMSSKPKPQLNGNYQ